MPAIPYGGRRKRGGRRHRRGRGKCSKRAGAIRSVLKTNLF